MLGIFAYGHPADRYIIYTVRLFYTAAAMR